VAWRDVGGLTPVGRATVMHLAISRAPRVAVRGTLIEEGVFPPPGDRVV
jgi:hypothetical protein